ncbi:MAG: DUF2911 domain-containing protein [Leeuwenhoekiella sp.]
MKKASIFLMILFFQAIAFAQIKTPAASPFSKIEQEVGLTNVTIAYSRPSMKGRAIFGDLVPYNAIWRTGANSTTKFTIDKSITIAGKELKEGTYSLYTIPQQDMWEFIFYTDDSDPLRSSFEDANIALRTMVEVQNFPANVETFTITIDDITSDGAVLGILWANTYAGLPFKVGTDKEVMTSIESTLKGPGADDYYNAAVYYLNSGKDIKKSKEWMDKAMSMTKEPQYWQLRQQSLVLAKSGDMKAAISAAEKSLAGAEKAGNKDYVKMNQDSLEAWGDK